MISEERRVDGVVHRCIAAWAPAVQIRWNDVVPLFDARGLKVFAPDLPCPGSSTGTAPTEVERQKPVAWRVICDRVMLFDDYSEAVSYCNPEEVPEALYLAAS
jgi:hypothetical protein